MSIADTLIKHLLADASLQRREDSLDADDVLDDGLLFPGIFDDALGSVDIGAESA